MDKAGEMIKEDAKVEVRGHDIGYVSRGGLKLEKAMQCLSLIHIFVINEAVELTKKYGADEDYQFVNGLLGTVAREQGLDAEPEQL